MLPSEILVNEVEEEIADGQERKFAGVRVSRKSSFSVEALFYNDEFAVALKVRMAAGSLSATVEAPASWKGKVRGRCMAKTSVPPLNLQW